MTPRATIVRVRPHAYKGGAHCYDITIREGLRGMTIPVLARSGIQAVTVARAVFDDAMQTEARNAN